MPETPRTWTLEGDLVGVPHEPITRVSDGYVDISEGPIEVVEKAPVDAEIERLQRAQEHEIAMRLRVERKHIPAPEHLPTPEEVNRQRERAERGDAERERLLDFVIYLYEGYCGRLRVSVQNELHQRVETVLREYGRLGKEES